MSTTPNPKTSTPTLKPHLAGLTPKQRKWVELTAKTGDGTKSAAVAYDSDNPRFINYQNNQKLYVRQAMLKELEWIGINEEKLSHVLSDGLSAEKFSKGGKKVSDHDVRLKSVDMVAKLKGLYPDKHVTVDKRVANVHLLPEKTPKQLQKRLKEAQKEIDRLHDL